MRDAERPLRRPHQRGVPQTLPPTTFQLASQPTGLLLGGRTWGAFGTRLASRHQALQGPAFQQVIMHDRDAQEAGRLGRRMLAGQDFQDDRCPLLRRRCRLTPQSWHR